MLSGIEIFNFFVSDHLNSLRDNKEKLSTSICSEHAKDYEGYHKSIEMNYYIIGIKPCLMQNLSVVPFLFSET